MLRFLFYGLVFFLFVLLIFDVLNPIFKWVKKISKKSFKLFKKIYNNIRIKINNSLEKRRKEKFENSHEGIMKDWAKNKKDIPKGCCSICKKEYVVLEDGICIICKNDIKVINN